MITDSENDIVADPKAASKHWSGEAGFIWYCTNLIHPFDGETYPLKARKIDYAVDYHATSAYVHDSLAASAHILAGEALYFALTFAQRLFCASAILARAAALRVRLFRGWAGAAKAALSFRPPRLEPFPWARSPPLVAPSPPARMPLTCSRRLISSSNIATISLVFIFVPSRGEVYPLPQAIGSHDPLNSKRSLSPKLLQSAFFRP